MGGVTVRCAVAPGPLAPMVADAIRAGGGVVVDVADADALVWTDPLDAPGLGELFGGGAPHPMGPVAVRGYRPLPFTH